MSFLFRDTSEELEKDPVSEEENTTDNEQEWDPFGGTGYNPYKNDKELEKIRKKNEAKRKAIAEENEHIDKLAANIIAITAESFPDKKYKVIGDAFGTIVESKNALSDLGASFKNLVGGELAKYTEMNKLAKKESVRRMKFDAAQQGADAVIAMRLNISASGIGNTDNMLTATAYGTAIKFIED